MQVEVVYMDANIRFRRSLRLPDGATVSDAIDESKLLRRVPSLDLLKSNKVGIFGQVIRKLSEPLNEGDRVEVYRPIVCDPETVPRRDRDDDDDDDDDD